MKALEELEGKAFLVKHNVIVMQANSSQAKYLGRIIVFLPSQNPRLLRVLALDGEVIEIQILIPAVHWQHLEIEALIYSKGPGLRSQHFEHCPLEAMMCPYFSVSSSKH